MEFLFLIGGMIIGIVFTLLVTKRESKIYGIVDIDHNSGLCRFHITSSELSDRRNTKAIFRINHNAAISREEQSL